MPKKPDFSKKILNILEGRQAVRVPDIKAEVASKMASKSLKKPQKAETYAITRSIKNLAESGLIETLEGGQSEYARLTQKGRQKLAALKLDSSQSLTNPTWDGKWRMILLDLPEERKAEREALRYLLKKAGFSMLKNSVWVSPFPFEFLFENIKKDFGLSAELIIIVTREIDEATDALLRETFRMPRRA